ncbi:MAG TPA: hypothetical protein PKA66_04110 [Gemmatimonadales bacterium]|nr:hypothetical protein [Gemmatimonadales bacterium]
MLRLRQLAAATCLVLGTALPAAAQVSFSPTIGAYLPTSNIADIVVGTDSIANFKQDVGLALGANLGVGLSSRVGLMVAGSYVPSQLSGTIGGDGSWSQSDANLFFGNANITVYLIKPTSPVWISLSGGGSMVSRSGQAYEGWTGTTDFGGLAGATIGFNLGIVNLNVSATDYIYGAQFSNGLVETSEATQNDILLGLGLGIPLGGKKPQASSQAFRQ